MSEFLIQQVTPDAAALAVAVNDRDRDEVARILANLDTPQLHALAIVLAAHIDPDRPFTPRAAPHSDPVGAAVRHAALRWRITTDDVTSRSRRRDHTDARAVVCYVAHRMGVTYSDIGRQLDRDHSTVMYACTRVGEDRRLRTAANAILDQLHPPQHQEPIAS